jgi:plastocyanin
VKRLIIAVALGAIGAAGITHTSVAVAQGGGTGTISGHVHLTGPAPANPLIRMGRDPICAKLNSAARPVQQIVLRSADGGLANVLVELQGTFPNTPVPGDAVVINQRNCMYVPRVVGARVGQTLRLVNSDTLLHNLHSISAKGNDFNETQPHSDMVFNYQLKAEEKMLRLKCDVHSWMFAYVAVETHPYFAVTKDDGAYSIANVPAGRYTIRAWHERYGWVPQMVEVKPGATATVDFDYTGNEKPAADSASIHELIVPDHTGA